MKSENTERLEMIRHLNKESGAGLLICYKVLKEYHYDEQKALAYLRSGTWKCDIEFLIRH